MRKGCSQQLGKIYMKIFHPRRLTWNLKITPFSRENHLPAFHFFFVLCYFSGEYMNIQLGTEVYPVYTFQRVLPTHNEFLFFEAYRTAFNPVLKNARVLRTHITHGDASKQGHLEHSLVRFIEFQRLKQATQKLTEYTPENLQWNPKMERFGR